MKKLSHHSKSDNTSIQFEVIDPEDNGNYTCIVENEAGVDKYTYEINIHYPPHILKNDNEILFNNVQSSDEKSELTEVEVELETELNLDCLVDGYPEPKV